MAATTLDAIMLFGDSITQGAWEFNGIGARLARKSLSTGSSHSDHIAEQAVNWDCLSTDIYARKFDVLNRGYSGYNTEWAIPVFEKVTTGHFPCGTHTHTRTPHTHIPNSSDIHDPGSSN